MHMRALLGTSMLVCVASLPAQAGNILLPAQIGGAYSVPATSLKEIRFRSTIRQQYDFSCGSAALATLLTHHYQRAVKEESVFAEMFARGDQGKIQREGFSLLDMKRYLSAHGFIADGFEAPLERLEEASIPAIALINEGGYNHFVVIKGMRSGRVLVGDPSGGTKAMSRQRFESVWVNQLLFVITNRTELARFNQDKDWRVAPKAPVSHAPHSGQHQMAPTPKFGPGDF